MKIDIFNTDKKYDIIYADPPWAFRVWSERGQGRSAEKHYHTMEKQDIEKLPVDKISNDIDNNQQNKQCKKNRTNFYTNII